MKIMAWGRYLSNEDGGEDDTFYLEMVILQRGEVVEFIILPLL